MSQDCFAVFTGNSNSVLAQAICDDLGVSLGGGKVKVFSDGESEIEIDENVRDKQVFIIQSTNNPANHHVMELLLLIDAMKRSSARKIIAVIPYFGYARQDKKTASRVPISARVVADTLEVVGVDRVITMDLHANQIQGFFKKPVDNLFARILLIKWIKEYFQDEELVVVSPDAGGVERARAYAKKLNAGLAIVDKRREMANKAKAMNLIGDVSGKTAILLDDMVDTAGTVQEAGGLLVDKGAREVHVVCSHGVYSGPAIERIQNSEIKQAVSTDSIATVRGLTALDKFKVVTSARLFSKAIKLSSRGDSLAPLFEDEL